MKKKHKTMLITTEIIVACTIAIAVIVLYFQFLSGIPKIDINIFEKLPQASIITDREGGELYRFYDENRRHIDYNNISHHMINAIVSTEDQSFWTNQGVERIAILRAAINNTQAALGQTTQLQGASTITQQLIKNLMLSREKTFRRKFQEIILAQKLTEKREKKLQEEEPTADKATIKRGAKEKILEAYLNYVYYGNHSYGIVGAAHNYFHTTPNQLTPLQSAILASLPQAPSSYNPLKHPETVLGNRKEENNTHTGAKITIFLHENNPYKTTITKTLSSRILLPTEEETCIIAIKRRASNIQYENHTTLSYEPGRKDRVLCRMYEDGYINIDEVRDNIIAGKDLKIHQAVNHLKAPHFVFWIEKFLQTSPLFQDLDLEESNLSHAGRTIKTSLDPLDQKIATETVQSNMKYVYKNGGNNRALIHVDSTNGDVRAYVGSSDYYDIENKGKNDLIQAKRQVGSTIKPLIYAYFYMQFGLTKGINTTIQDLKLPKEYAPRGQPNNADEKYRGKITLKKALASSRNIPVIKLFYITGREWNIIPYLQSLGFLDLKDDYAYGYPLALGAGEGSAVQLANSYIELSSDQPNTVSKINPIISITDNQGNIIYEKATSTTHQRPRIIPSSVSYMIRESLSNTKNAPSKRYYYLMVPSMEKGSYAIKTGTSEKKYGKKSFPNDAWIATYTNRDIIVSWAGHTDGKALGEEGYGLFLNHRIIKDYYRELNENNILLGGKKIKPEGYKGYYIPAQNNKLKERQMKLMYFK